jgi:ABC-type sugar transport system permease subunit
LAVVVLTLVPLVFETAMSLTDFQRTSIRDGINGGVLREAIGGLTGAIPVQPFDLDASTTDVHFVGLDLLSAFFGGVWLGGNTSAMFPAFSVLWMILSVGLQAAVGIGVAIILARPGLRFVVFWRTLFILPWAIPEFVGAIAWRNIVEPENGWIALLLGMPFAWPDSPDAALVVLLVAGTWVGWPLMMLVATAGLRTIPQAVTDAARLEGAGAVARFRRITLPLLFPLLAPAVVIRAVAAFNQFYLFYVLQPPDPTITSATFSYYVFDSSGGPGLFAVSAAVNVLTVVALGVVVVWFMRWRGRAERVALW